MPAKAKGLVLDTNILIRAVLGHRVRDLLNSYEESNAFCAPDVCFDEARKNIPSIAIVRRVNPGEKLLLLEQLLEVIKIIDSSYYEPYASAARQRVDHRDLDDWPIVATALLLNSPIWTEDFDFFGCGIATWTTATVELYLSGSEPPAPKANPSF